jgi:hypothetical protein
MDYKDGKFFVPFDKSGYELSRSVRQPDAGRCLLRQGSDNFGQTGENQSPDHKAEAFGLSKYIECKDGKCFQLKELANRKSVSYYKIQLVRILLKTHEIEELVWNLMFGIMKESIPLP